METLIKYVAGLLVAKYGLDFVLFFMRMIKLYLLPNLGLGLKLKKYGSWAVVTGATDGIGKAIAKQLAKRGINLVLISRSEEKLKATAQEIGGKVDVKTISYDFSNPDGYSKIETELKNLDIGLLVNNVGMGYDHPDFYLHYDEQYFDKMIDINVTSVLKMTRIVLDGMVQRKKGLLVHVSSASSLMPIPFLSGYSASKSFVNNFGESLHYEYMAKGIKSQVVFPYFVATKMSKMRSNGFLVPSADQYACQMVNAIGLTPTMAGYWAHELFLAVSTLLPRWLVIGQTRKMMDATRRRWEKKQQAKKD
eukprot:TCONS_00073228-protein